MTEFEFESRPMTDHFLRNGTGLLRKEVRQLHETDLQYDSLERKAAWTGDLKSSVRTVEKVMPFVKPVTQGGPLKKAYNRALRKVGFMKYCIMERAVACYEGGSVLLKAERRRQTIQTSMKAFSALLQVGAKVRVKAAWEDDASRCKMGRTGSIAELADPGRSPFMSPTCMSAVPLL
jgi:hypothetical protein